MSLLVWLIGLSFIRRFSRFSWLKGSNGLSYLNWLSGLNRLRFAEWAE